MRSFHSALFSSILLIGCSGVIEQAAPGGSREATGAGQATLPVIGGSNYVMIDIGAYREAPTSANWFKPGGLQPTVAWYHKNIAKVRGQLRAMRQAGQQRLALMIWISALSERGHDDDVYGHVIDASSGRLRPRHEENLLALIDDIADAGFRGLTIRIANQGSLDPGTWTSWNEHAFHQAWNFIANTKRAADARAAQRGLPVGYDLGVELGGLEKGQARIYTRKLLAHYEYTFGDYGNGFSLAYTKSRLRRYIDDLRQVGAKVPAYYLDIYDDVFWALKHVAEVLGEKEIPRAPVVIQETYYNDRQANRDIWRAKEELQLNIRSIYQWPNHRASGSKHFSVHYPREYGAYAGRPADPPRIARAGTGCYDDRCIWIRVESPGTRPCVQVWQSSSAAPILDEYCGNDITLHSQKAPALITLRLRQRNNQWGELSRRGLRIAVVNKTAGVRSPFANVGAPSVPPLQPPPPPEPPPPPQPPSPPQPQPAAKPVITAAGRGCDDGLCVWIRVKNPGSAPCIDVRKNGSGELLDRYCGDARSFYPNRSPAAITFRVRDTRGQRDLLRSGSLRVWVVNGVGRTWSDGYLVP